MPNSPCLCCSRRGSYKIPREAPFSGSRVCPAPAGPPASTRILSGGCILDRVPVLNHQGHGSSRAGWAPHSPKQEKEGDRKVGVGDLGDTTSSKTVTSCLQLAAIGCHGQGAVWRRGLWRKPLCVGEGRAHRAQVRIHLQEVLCQVLSWAAGGRVSAGPLASASLLCLPR